MKSKITMKRAAAIFQRMATIPYCDAAYLLGLKQPFAYSCGVYGWNCDYYALGAITIATGYRTPGRAPAVPRELLKKYEDKARELATGKNAFKPETMQARRDLLDSFMVELQNALF